MTRKIAAQILFFYDLLLSKKGFVSQIDGLIAIPLRKDIEESVRHFLMKHNYYPAIPLDTKSILSRGVSKDKALEIVNLLLDAEPKGIHHFLADLVISRMSH